MFGVCGHLTADPRAMQHHQRGVMAHVQGDIEGAKAEFRAAIGVSPSFAYAYYRLGFVLQEEKERLRQEQLREQARSTSGHAAVQK